jgi:hypothetical protein
VGAEGANVTPHIDGGHAKEAEPWPEDAPGLVALILRSLRGPDFSTSQEATLDDVMSISESSNIADLGTRGAGAARIPSRATSAC